MQNQKVVLTRPLRGVPAAGDFGLVTETLPEPGPGEFLVRHIYLSLDPYQRSASPAAMTNARWSPANSASGRA